MIIVAPLLPADVPEVAASFAAIGWDKPASLYERYLREQERGERRVFVARQDRAFVGYVTALDVSPYPPFSADGIPEIVDLNVLPTYRRNGIATVLMNEAEAVIAQYSSVAGIAVGLTEDYGPAQRLYAARGYVPDGRGLAWRDRLVAFGETVGVDDDLVLHLIKSLRARPGNTR